MENEDLIDARFRIIELEYRLGILKLDVHFYFVAHSLFIFILLITLVLKS